MIGDVILKSPQSLDKFLMICDVILKKMYIYHFFKSKMSIKISCSNSYIVTPYIVRGYIVIFLNFI